MTDTVLQRPRILGRRRRADTGPSRSLVPAAFGCNPGGLAARKFVPRGLAPNAPLVIVLHGCTQTPTAYDAGTGWTYLAEQHGFAVLFAEQRRVNNLNGCFNWYKPGDMQRDAGEPASIKSMIDQAVGDHAIDRARVFITGLSAGAAMAGVMLATYPETFAGGGLIAGLPYGVARSSWAALGRMRYRGWETDTQLAAFVQMASSHDGPWPIISVWHGTADETVSAANANATVAQWLAVHGLTGVEPTEESVDGHVHRAWRNAENRVCVEEYVVAGMGHGTPIDAAQPNKAERAGPYALDMGLSSTQALAASWGLTRSVSAG